MYTLTICSPRIIFYYTSYICKHIYLGCFTIYLHGIFQLISIFVFSFSTFVVSVLHSRLEETIKQRQVPYEVIQEVHEFLEEMLSLQFKEESADKEVTD